MYRWLFCLTILSCQVAAQNPADSLYIKLNIARRTADHYEIGNNLSKIAYIHLQSRSFDSAHYYYHQALSWNKHHNNKNLVGRNYNDLGILSNDLGFPDSAATYYNNAIAVYSEIKDTTSMLETKVNLGIFYKNQGLYQESIDISLEAAIDLEKISQNRTLASSYNTVALAFELLKNFEESRLFHSKALAIRKKIDYQRGVGQSYNNIGNLFKAFKQYDSASYYYDKALKIKRSQNDATGSASTLNNMGEVLMAEGKLPEAELHFQESLKLRREGRDLSGQVVSLNSLGDLTLRKNNLSQSQQYLSEAEKLGMQLNLQSELADNYRLQTSLFRKSGDYRKSLLYSQKLIEVKDTLFNIDKLHDIMRNRILYERDKVAEKIHSLEQEKSLREAELKVKKTQVVGLVVGIILIAIIGALIFEQLRLTERNKKKVETLLRELHHRVKNNLQVLSSVLTLQTTHLKDLEALQEMKSTEGRVNAMALIHKKLYHDENSRDIKLPEYFKELTEYLAYSYGFTENHHKLTVNVDDISLDVDKVIPLGLITNELVSNALKYAFKDQPKPELQIQLKHVQKTLVLIVDDNGKGFPDTGNNDKTSFGLQLVKTFVKELQGVLKVDTSNGTRYEITIQNL